MSTTIPRRRGKVFAALGLAAALGTAGFAVAVEQAPAGAATTIDSTAYYQLVNRASGKAMDVEAAGTADGTDIAQWTSNGNPNQQWQFVSSGNGYYRLRARHSGKVADVLDKSTADGADVVQWTDVDGDNQQWSVQDTSDGYVSLINRRSGKALDVEGSSTADGADILQWTRNGNPNQQWQLVRAGSGGGGTPPPPPPGGGNPGTPGSFSVPNNLGTHDPSRVAYDNGVYAFYSTGGNIPVWYSTDGRNWRRGPDVFSGIPESVRRLVPVNNGVWAPDIIWNPNTRLWNLYYSVANWDDASKSAIGLVTSPTLNPSSSGYRWTDRGVVITTQPNNGAYYSSIDPAPFFDGSGNLRMVFGSGYSSRNRTQGINVILLDRNTGLRSGTSLTTLLSCGCEASYIQYHGGYYYLFWNTGGCCSGASSSYTIHVARSRSATGPYTERSAKFLSSYGGVHGPGHIGITNAGNADYYTYHYYPDSGGSVLGKGTIRWASDGWPYSS